MNDHVYIPSNFGLDNENVTIEAWVYLDSTSERGGFVKIGREDGYGFGVGGSRLSNHGNDLILIYEYERWIDTNVQIGTGWHHVAMVIDNSGVPHAYLDGRYLGSYGGRRARNPSADIRIGGWDYGRENRSFGGKIDEVGIYNRALSRTQIVESMNNGIQGDEQGLVAYYAFDGDLTNPLGLDGTFAGGLDPDSFVMVEPDIDLQTHYTRMVGYDSFGNIMAQTTRTRQGSSDDILLPGTDLGNGGTILSGINNREWSYLRDVVIDSLGQRASAYEQKMKQGTFITSAGYKDARLSGDGLSGEHVNTYFHKGFMTGFWQAANRPVVDSLGRLTDYRERYDERFSLSGQDGYSRTLINVAGITYDTLNQIGAFTRYILKDGNFYNNQLNSDGTALEARFNYSANDIAFPPDCADESVTYDRIIQTYTADGYGRIESVTTVTREDTNISVVGYTAGNWRIGNSRLINGKYYTPAAYMDGGQNRLKLASYGETSAILDTGWMTPGQVRRGVQLDGKNYSIYLDHGQNYLGAHHFHFVLEEGDPPYRYIETTATREDIAYDSLNRLTGYTERTVKSGVQDGNFYTGPDAVYPIKELKIVSDITYDFEDRQISYDQTDISSSIDGDTYDQILFGVDRDQEAALDDDGYFQVVFCRAPTEAERGFWRDKIIEAGVSKTNALMMVYKMYDTLLDTEPPPEALSILGYFSTYEDIEYFRPHYRFGMNDGDVNYLFERIFSSSAWKGLSGADKMDRIEEYLGSSIPQTVKDAYIDYLNEDPDYIYRTTNLMTDIMYEDGNGNLHNFTGLTPVIEADLQIAHDNYRAELDRYMRKAYRVFQGRDVIPGSDISTDTTIGDQSQEYAYWKGASNYHPYQYTKEKVLWHLIAYTGSSFGSPHVPLYYYVHNLSNLPGDMIYSERNTERTDTQYNANDQIIGYDEIRTSILDRGATTFVHRRDIEYDAYGNVSGYTEVKHSTGFDEKGRVVNAQYPDSVSPLALNSTTTTKMMHMMYDEIGNLVSYYGLTYGDGVTPNLAITKYITYDQSGRVIRNLSTSTRIEVDMEKNEIYYIFETKDTQGIAYDAFGNPISKLEKTTITKSKPVFGRDGTLERINTETKTETVTERNWYDALGRLKRQERSGEMPKHGYVYDSFGRVLQYSFSRGGGREWTRGKVYDMSYNKLGNMISHKVHSDYYKRSKRYKVRSITTTYLATLFSSSGREVRQLEHKAYHYYRVKKRKRGGIGGALGSLGRHLGKLAKIVTEPLRWAGFDNTADNIAVALLFSVSLCFGIWGITYVFPAGVEEIYGDKKAGAICNLVLTITEIVVQVVIIVVCIVIGYYAGPGGIAAMLKLGVLLCAAVTVYFETARLAMNTLYFDQPFRKAFRSWAKSVGIAVASVLIPYVGQFLKGADKVIIAGMNYASFGLELGTKMAQGLTWCATRMNAFMAWAGVATAAAGPTGQVGILAFAMTALTCAATIVLLPVAVLVNSVIWLVGAAVRLLGTWIANVSASVGAVITFIGRAIGAVRIWITNLILSIPSNLGKIAAGEKLGATGANAAQTNKFVVIKEVTRRIVVKGVEAAGKIVIAVIQYQNPERDLGLFNLIAYAILGVIAETTGAFRGGVKSGLVQLVYSFEGALFNIGQSLALKEVFGKNQATLRQFAGLLLSHIITRSSLIRMIAGGDKDAYSKMIGLKKGDTLKFRAIDPDTGTRIYDISRKEGGGSSDALYVMRSQASGKLYMVVKDAKGFRVGMETEKGMLFRRVEHDETTGIFISREPRISQEGMLAPADSTQPGDTKVAEANSKIATAFSILADKEFDFSVNGGGLFWKDENQGKKIDRDLLAALGEPTPARLWLAASLDKTIRLHLSLPFDMDLG